MRCFRSCFCLPDKRKKRLKSSSVSSRDARHSSYRPLASFLEEDDDPEVVGNPGGSSVTRKKVVRFDLNVQAYEPMPCSDYDSLESDSEEIFGQDSCKETTPIINLMEESAYPSSHRYWNCRDSSDEEEDGFLSDDRDLEFEHDEDDSFEDGEICGGCRQFDLRSRKDEAPTRLDSDGSSSEEQEQSSLAKLPEEKRINPEQPLSTNLRPPCTVMKSSENARLRNHYVHSVLNPVENTLQWKTVKAKATLPNQKPSKENMEREREVESAVTSCKSNSQVQHVPVNCSLSNWLVPVEN
ncbi:hypothetical protein MLD38_039569 [Melastoma candidum]|uniref:Uncharacterized protein n=1 Tax=Melastoma candidum TaxID=119954 RepID=A0ACB9L3Q8_9MYRT|nr:hypothetical protein MLD38_039569 [Melastoma candidum]